MRRPSLRLAGCWTRTGWFWGDFRPCTLVTAQVTLHIELQAATFPIPDIVVHEAAESGAAFGAACMLHRRFLSLESTALSKGA